MRMAPMGGEPTFANSAVNDWVGPQVDLYHQSKLAVNITLLLTIRGSSNCPQWCRWERGRGERRDALSRAEIGTMFLAE
jgi:hypothetical protein